MTDPTRIRAQSQPGGGAVVRVLMAHEMESGQRKDPAGKTVPAWHVTEVNVSLNGQPVLSAQWGPGVSKNPFMAFTLPTAKAGDKLGVSWLDTRGERRGDEAVVA